VSTAELIAAWEAFKAENPGADPVMFEAYLDLLHDQGGDAPPPALAEEDVRQMLRTVGS
jgi:hypothetical protein